MTLNYIEDDYLDEYDERYENDLDDWPYPYGDDWDEDWLDEDDFEDHYYEDVFDDEEEDIWG